MILYHGSYVEIPKPDIVHSRRNVDFGAGFYTTPLYEQAKKWCRKFTDRGRDASISSYDMNEKALNDFKVLRFDSYSKEWLDYIAMCRNGKDETDYDIVMGGIANDKVFNTVELYLNGLINREEAIGRLQYEKPNYQVAFRTQKTIDAILTFKESEKI